MTRRTHPVTPRTFPVARALALAFALLAATRVLAAPDPQALARQTLAAYGGKAAFEQVLLHSKCTGQVVSFLPIRNTAQFTMYRDGERSRVELTLAGLRILQGFDGADAWMRFGGVTNPLPDAARKTLAEERDTGLNALLYLDEPGTQVKPLAGHDGIGFTIVTPEGHETALVIDPDTKLVQAAYGRTTHPQSGREVDSVSEYSDYRAVRGAQFPFSATTDLDGHRTTEMHYETNEAFTPTDPAMFARPVAKTGAPAAPVTIPAQLNQRHILVPVRVNGSKPVTFILDTGAGMTCLDAGFAKGLGIKGAGKMEAAAAGGGVPLELSGGVTLQLGDLTHTTESVGLLDLSTIGRSFNVTLGGILGYDFLAQYATTLDYTTPAVTFSDPDRAAASADAIPFEVTNAFIQVRGKINDDREILFLLDTGAGFTILPRSVAESLPGRRLRGNQAMGAEGGRLPMTLVRVPRLTFGAQSLTDLVVAYSEGDSTQIPGALGMLAREGMGLLGADVLSRYRVTINYRRRTLDLQPATPTAPRTDDWIQVGVQCLHDETGYVVRGVFSPSPAEKAGIQAGDRVVSIDGQPVAGLSPDEVAARLRGRAGSIVELVIERNGDRLTVRVKRAPLL